MNYLHSVHSKIISSLHLQIALLRIGMTDAGRGSLGSDALLTADEVTAALANPLPSELLLKGIPYSDRTRAPHIY